MCPEPWLTVVLYSYLGSTTRKKCRAPRLSSIVMERTRSSSPTRKLNAPATLLPLFDSRNASKHPCNIRDSFSLRRQNKWTRIFATKMCTASSTSFGFVESSVWRPMLRTGKGHCTQLPRIRSLMPGLWKRLLPEPTVKKQHIIETPREYWAYWPEQLCFGVQANGSNDIYLFNLQSRSA